MTDKSEGGGIYHTLPRSLKKEVLVRSKIEEPETQKLRAETIKSKSVHELSEIKSIDDFPLPSTVENFVARARSPSTRPVERRKRFREK